MISTAWPIKSIYLSTTLMIDSVKPDRGSTRSSLISRKSMWTFSTFGSTLFSRQNETRPNIDPTLAEQKATILNGANMCRLTYLQSRPFPFTPSRLPYVFSSIPWEILICCSCVFCNMVGCVTCSRKHFEDVWAWRCSNEGRILEPDDLCRSPSLPT